MSAPKRRKHTRNNPKFKVPKTSDGSSSSSNRFQLLSDEEEAVVFKEKMPPIIVDQAHNFSTVMGLIGEKYTYNRMTLEPRFYQTLYFIA